MRKLVLAAFVLSGAFRAAGQTPFEVPAGLARQGLFSCSDLRLESGATVRSAGNTTAGAAGARGNVVSNGDVILSGRVFVDGDATAGPGRKVDAAPEATVTGLSTSAPSAADCRPVDLAALRTTYEAANENARLPRTAKGKSPLRDGGLYLEENDFLTLPAGTYVVSSVTLERRALLNVSGPVRILCTGDVRLTGNSNVNPAGGAFNLRLFSSGASVSLDTLSTFGGILYAPDATVAVRSESRVVGAVFAASVSLSDSSNLTRVVDDVPPQVTITAPVDGASVASLSAVRVRGFVSHTASAVRARLNGAPLPLGPDGSFDALADLSSASTPDVIVTATQALGLTREVRVRVCTAPPGVALVSPADGSYVADSIVDLAGTCGTATRVSVGGTNAACTNGAFRIPGFNLGGDGVHTLVLVASNACAESRAVAVVTVDSQPPSLAIDTPAPGTVFGASPITVSGTVRSLRLREVRVGSVVADISGGRFTARNVPIPPGPSSLTAVATDMLGRSTTSLVVPVILDQGAPSVLITNPASGAVVGTTTVTVEGTVTGAAVTSVTVAGRTAALNGSAFTATGVPLSEGDNLLTAVAAAAGGLTYTSPAVAVVRDTLPPQVTIDQDVLPAVTDQLAVTVTGTASDPHLASVTVNGAAAALSGTRFTATNVPLAEGDNALRARAADTVANAADSAPLAISRDTLPPAVALTYPAPGAKIGSTPVTVTGTVSDPHLTSVTVGGVTATVAGGQFTAPGVTLPEGDVVVTALATDVLGHTATASSPATVDTLSPVVAIDQPLNPLVTTPAITVTGSVVETHLLSLTVNGVAAAVSGDRWIAVNVPLAEGVQQIRALADDTFGHHGESSAVTWELVSAPPSLTIDSPSVAPGACLAAGPPVTVSGRILDGRSGGPAPSVRLTVRPADGFARDYTAVVDGTAKTWSVAAVDLGATDGTTSLSAVSTGLGGLTASTLKTVRVKASLPVVRLLLDGAAFPGSAAGAAPAAGAPPVLFNRSLLPRAQVLDSPDAAPPPAALTLDGAPYVEGTSITAEGTHLLTARAVDCAGREAFAHALFTIDVTPPRLISTTPADGASLGAQISSFSGTSDPDLASAAVNGLAAAVSNGTFTLAPFPWKEGTNAVSIVLTDRAGNAASYGRSFSLKTLGPSVEILESGFPIPPGVTFFRAATPVVSSNDPAATITATLNGAPFVSGTAVSTGGDYSLSATASDALGHAASATATFKVDLTPGPGVNITSPADRAVLPGPTVAVTGTASASVVNVTVNGRAAALASGSWTLPDLALQPDVINEITAIGSDAAGRTASDTRQVLLRSAGPGVLILDPPDGFATNRKKVDVAGAVVGGPAATVDGNVVVAGRTLALDPLGRFRAADVPLADGPNTLTASAVDSQGRTGLATVHVTSDASLPGILLSADGQPLVDGASFIRPFTLRVEVTKPSGTPPIPTIRLNGQEQAATSAVTDIPIAANGGYVVSVVARDASANESRADRGFTLSLGGCAITELEPADGSAVAASTATIRGRSGDAKAITLRVPNPGTSPVTYQSFPAPLADGTFALGDVPLPAVGENVLQIDCTDRGGEVRTTPLKLTRLPSGAGPAVHITSPAGGGRQTAAATAVSGTVSDGTAAVTVNGLAATVTPGAGGDGTFTIPAVPLAEGPNVLFARALDRAGRSGEDRIVFFRDSAAPKVQITSPVNNAHVGPRGSGPAAVDVTGLVDITTEPNLASVVVAAGAGSVTAAVDLATGAFSAPGVPLSASSPDTPQTVTATATDTLGQTGTSSVTVFFDAAGPALLLSQPADLTRYSETAPPQVPVSGEAWAADGAQISINGGGLDPATLSWEAAADGRRHTAFSASVGLPTADGAFGIVARVEEPSGKFANDKRLLFRDGTAPTVVEMLPQDGSRTVDPNEILLVLFSEPVLGPSLNSADGLTLTRVSTGDTVAGFYTMAGNAVALTPASGMARGESYRFRAGAGVTDFVGHALAAPKQVTFTIALSPSGSAPSLDPVAAVLCATDLTVSGTAAPGASLRLRDGTLSFSAVADSAGRFSVKIPLSGNGFHSLRVVAVDRGTGASSPETVVLIRVDCSAPSVVAAAFDRTSGRVTVSFSEAMKPETLGVGAPPAAIRVSDAEDANRVPQGAALSLSADGTIATLDLGSAPDAWWRTKPVRLEAGPPASDVRGNPMAAKFETVFFPGGGDLSGAFLSGEAYDEESGRPLAGASVSLFPSGGELPAFGRVPAVAAPVASTVTDGRGRFSLVGDVPAGRYALFLSRGGYTRVVRRLALEPAVGAVPFDSRLTPLAAASPSLLNPAAGGTFEGPAGSSLVLDVAPGALPGGSLGVVLTPLSGQGLPDLLPLGWTPLAAAEVRLLNGDEPLPEGTATPFAAGSVKLTLPLPAGLSPAANLYAARYDVASGLWVSLAVPEKLSGAGGEALARVTLVGPGSMAVLVPDADPTAPPSLPNAPDMPLAGSSLPISIPALTAQIALDPPVVSPTGRASARVVALSADGSAPWPSGLAVQAYLDEKLILSGGGELYESPFSTDLVLYHSPLTADEQGSAAPAAAGAMGFRVSPSPRAAQVLLETGYENIRLYPFPDQIERGSVLGPPGGSVTSTDGTDLFLPEGALPQKTVVKARLLTAGELSAVTVPQGFTLVAGVRVDLSGYTLARAATLKIDAQPGLPADAPDDPRLVLAVPVDQPVDNRGAFSRVVGRAALLPAAGGAPAKIVSGPEATASTLPLAGITAEGVYLFLHANAPIGFATGLVKGGAGTGTMNARVTAAGLGTADLSQPGGRYSVPAPAGSAQLSAIHPTLSQTGTASIPSLGKGEVAQVDILISAVPPTVRSLQPANGATSQPVGTAAAVTFSTQLDPASVTSATLTLELASADGTGTGLLFNGTVALSPDNLSVVFAPTRPLPPGRKILASLKAGVRGADGTPYSGPLPATWSFTTSTVFVTGGAIHPEKIRLLVPVNGTAQITGDAGALPLVTAGNPPWSVWADVDGALACPSVTTYPADNAGGFTATAGCPPTASVTIASKVYIHILDPTGAQAATYRLGPFVTPDGKGFVAPAGEETVFTTAEGIVVTAPAAAFDEPTLVTVRKMPLDALGVAVQAGMEMAAVVDVDFKGTAKETLRLKIPVTTAAPVGSLSFAGSAMDLPWGRKLRVLDLGRVVADASGQKFISTAEEDQPDDPAAQASGGRQALAGRTPQALSKKLTRTLLAELTARATAGFILGATFQLAAITGQVAPIYIGAQFFVLYNAIADTFIYLAASTNWNGGYILPDTGREFTVVQRDLSTGWILARKAYPATSGGAGQLINVGPLEPGPSAPPVLVDASPFRVTRYSVPPVEGSQAEANVRLSPSLESHTIAAGKTALRPVSEFPLPDRTSVELYNVTKSLAKPPSGTAWARSFVRNGTFAEKEIGTGAGDDAVAIVSPGDLDPAVVPAIDFVFSRPLVQVDDASTLVTLTDCGAMDPSAPTDPPACTTPKAIGALVTQDENLTRIHVELAGPLTRGHQYKAELKNIKAGPSPEVTYPTDAPATFFFATRATGSELGKTVVSPLGDTNSARDLLKLGNLLMVASATGRLVAVDVSDPKNPTRFALLNGGGTSQMRALATDGHNRLFYNVERGASWGVRGVRLEDVRGATRSACGSEMPEAWQSDPPPCFDSVVGGVRTAFSVGSTNGLTASEYIALVGSLAVGTPSDMQITVQDDVDGPYGVKELYEKQYGEGSFAALTPKPDGFYEFDVKLNTTTPVDRRAARKKPRCGEQAHDRYQRVTVDNLGTGHGWSTDVENTWPGGSGSGEGKVRVRARPGDRLQIRYNVTATGYIAIVGSGVTSVDLNRFYRNPAPGFASQSNTGECGRHLGVYEGADLPLYSSGGQNSAYTCANPVTREDAGKLLPIAGISWTPALAVDPRPSAGNVHVFSVLTHFGAIHTQATVTEPGNLMLLTVPPPDEYRTPAEARCLKETVPPAPPPPPPPAVKPFSPRALFRAIALAPKATWKDRRIVTDGADYKFKTKPVEPAPDPAKPAKPPPDIEGDLLFFSLGDGGVATFDARDRSLQKLIGRFYAKGHSVYRLQADVPGGRLFAGGQDKDGNPIIDVWDIFLANGGPSKDGVFPAPNGEEAIDPRLIATLSAPWDTNHIGLDDSGIGLIYTWGARPTPPPTKDDPPGREEGGFVVPVQDPSFVFSGLYLEKGQSPPPEGSTDLLVSTQSLASRLIPLGVPMRATPAAEKEAEKRIPDEERGTASFKVRVSLPGGLGEKLTAKVQALTRLPEAALLAKEDLGGYVARPGGPGWPDRNVWVTLRRLGKKDANDPDGKETNPYNLYESEEIVVLIADPRARLEYWKNKQDLGKTEEGDEKTQCRRCERPYYLPKTTTNAAFKIKELLAGGPYVRAILSPDPDPNADGGVRTATNAALAFFQNPKVNYHAPSGTVSLTGWADEVASPTQIALLEPAQNPAFWYAEGGASVSLTSGEGVVETADHAVRGRSIGFEFDRTYRSNVIGYGPLGSAGWASSLFAHLREIPLPGEEEENAAVVQYHDGTGRVWSFPTPVGGACPAGTESDQGETYCTPKGLYLKLVKDDKQKKFTLTGRNNDKAVFGLDGRLLEIVDRLRQTKDPSASGGSLSFFYDPFGDLVGLEDELGRTYRLKYDGDPASPTFGLLDRIDDFADRTLRYKYDGRRLSDVVLPDVFTSTLQLTQSAPTIHYTYATDSLGNEAPAHGDDFGKIRLRGFTLPGAAADRIQFRYDASSARVIGFSAAPVDDGGPRLPWTLSYTPATAAPATAAGVAYPWGLAASYTLEKGRIRRIARVVEVASGGPPVDAALTDESTYLDDGRVDTVTRADGGKTTYTYESPATRLKRANVANVTHSPGSRPGLADYGEIAEKPAYQGDNLVESVTDPEGRVIRTAVSAPDVTGVTSGFDAENVTGKSDFDPYGRVRAFRGGNESERLQSTYDFKPDARGREKAGFLERAAQGSVSEKYSYDDKNRGNVTRVEASHGPSSTVDYDEWDRPVREVAGRGAGGYADVSQEVKRGYDATGHLKLVETNQKGLGKVRTEYFYNAREQVVRIRRDQLAGRTPDGGLVAADTVLDYDPSTGLLQRVTSPAGIVTGYSFDKMARVKSVTPAGSGTRTMGYDEMGRLTYATDGENGVWKGTYDGWGRLFKEELPTLAVVERTFDKAGGLTKERLKDSDTVLAELTAHVNSFGAADKVVQLQAQGSTPQSLTVSRTFDSNGRLVGQKSDERLDLGLAYEANSGRVTRVSDATREMRFGYTSEAANAPWPKTVEEAEAASGGGAFLSTGASDLARDSFGRVRTETRNDGSTTDVDYDESGRPLSLLSAGAVTGFSWDSAGKLLKLTRPLPQGDTSFGYDPDGRVLVKRSLAAGIQVFETRYEYDTAGRVVTIHRPDTSIETYEYYTDDVLKKLTRSDGVSISYEYDPANRLKKRTPAGGPGVALDGGESFTWDGASRLISTQRLRADGTPNTATAVVLGGYDMAGRPGTETVGQRQPLTRRYDVFGKTIALGLPAGIGGAAGFGYSRTYEPGTNRLVSISATGAPTGPGGVPLASIGATWAWVGDDKLLGITTHGPLATAHRFGYIGGPGAQPPPPGSPVPAATWRLGTLTVGTAGASDPIAEAGKLLGAAGGSAPWGQFAYGYRTGANGDASKLGRLVTGTGLTKGSLLSGQGWAWGLDQSRRLTRAFTGGGNIDGADAASAGLGTFERFRYGYGTADQLTQALREVAGEVVEYTTGAEGRPLSRSVDVKPASGIGYDELGRRTEDDRYQYRWWWHGKIARITVKQGWGGAYEGQQVRFEYDSLGRLFSKTHYGKLPAGGDDEAVPVQRPFIEKREYLFDGDTLLAEAAYAQDGAIRWRKSYVPGARGLNDHVQMRVEVYDGAGVNVVTDRLFSYLRDELGTVLGMVEERASADPRSPPLPVKYLCDPFGSCHAETGPEERSAKLDLTVTGVTKPDNTTATQTVPDTNHIRGALRAVFSATLDPNTYGGIAFEKKQGDGSWAAIDPATYAIGAVAGGLSEEIVLLPLSGFELGTVYRVRFTNSLRDSSGRAVSAAPDLTIPFPPPIPEGQVGTLSVVFEKTFPIQYESYLAAGESAGGALIGGQPFLFQGMFFDNVTGLGLTKNRLYDPRMGAWLSPDPMGDQDSVNRFGFVGMRPNEKTDPLGLESFGEFVSEYTEEAFTSGGFWKRAAATGLTLLDTTFQVVSVGATKKIDRAQEQLDRGQITRGQYWKKTGVAVAQTAATYAGGAGAGAVGARVGVRVLGSRGVTALGVRTSGAIGGASGGAGGQLAADVVGIAAGEQKELSSGETYLTATLIGGAIGAAGAIPGRTPRDVAVNPEPPPVRPLNRPIGRPSHNAALREEIKKALAEGASDFRVNQQQITTATPEAPAGVHVGTNRPDLQYTNASGRRVFFEFDAPPMERAVPHALRLLSNDPSSIVFLRTIP